jgi:hypothetical protein
VYVLVFSPPFTYTTLTKIDDVKSNVSFWNGEGPTTLVNVNV